MKVHEMLKNMEFRVRQKDLNKFDSQTEAFIHDKRIKVSFP